MILQNFFIILILINNFSLVIAVEKRSPDKNYLLNKNNNFNLKIPLNEYINILIHGSGGISDISNSTIIYPSDPTFVTLTSITIYCNDIYSANLFSNNINANSIKILGITTPLSGIVANLAIGSDGKIYKTGSSEKYKKNIKKIDEKSILDIDKIELFSFEYKNIENQIQYGCIAEQAEKVSQDLVQYDREKKPVNFDYQSFFILCEVKNRTEKKKLKEEIKESEERIMKSEERIMKLEERIMKLEERI